MKEIGMGRRLNVVCVCGCVDGHCGCWMNVRRLIWELCLFIVASVGSNVQYIYVRGSKLFLSV